MADESIIAKLERLGIIDQWGNGLKLVAEEMKLYPEIEFRWQEVGLSFQVQFVKKEYYTDKTSILGGNNGGDGGNIGGDGGNRNIAERIINLILQNDEISVQELANKVGISKRNCERIIAELKRKDSIRRIGSARTGRWIVNRNRSSKEKP